MAKRQETRGERREPGKSRSQRSAKGTALDLKPRGRGRAEAELGRASAKRGGAGRTAYCTCSRSTMANSSEVWWREGTRIRVKRGGGMGSGSLQRRCASPSLVRARSSRRGNLLSGSPASRFHFSLSQPPHHPTPPRPTMTQHSHWGRRITLEDKRTSKQVTL